ncbi:EGF-like domain [Babesia duncani]|uniref:EGF-like domain n=1 Tax=Babesia duncani TaxID=323732 RepID=A0AAD9UQA6_9APIC|nr:EGF-like domain [Babesia duncani]
MTIPSYRSSNVVVGIFWLIVAFCTHYYIAAAKDVPCEEGHHCLNESKCVKINVGGVEKKVCICSPGFTGWNCSIQLDYCNKHCRPLHRGITCQQALCNQGTCLNQTEPPYYSCDCGAFYTGPNCEIENNPCSSESTNPCVNGKCNFIKGTNQVVCNCYPGWATNPNQQITTIDWNTASIHVAPPCTEEIKRGITGNAPQLSTSTYRNSRHITFRC